jgi:hypothetical protein
VSARVNPTPAAGRGAGADPGAGADALAARQLALVSALVAGGDPPAGLDPERVRIQAEALVRKRARSVARHVPELAAKLAADFWPLFERYAAARSCPPASSAADAKHFARYLRDTRRRRWLPPKPGQSLECDLASQPKTHGSAVLQTLKGAGLAPAFWPDGAIGPVQG